MKKIFVSLAALVMSASAFAQSAESEFISNVIFSAPDQEVIDEEENMYELATPGVTITMEFKDYDAKAFKDLGYSPKLMVATGMGFGVEPQIYDLESKDSTFTFSMNEESWGQPYMGMLNAVMMVCFMNEDNDFYVDSDDEPLFFQAVYTAPNTFPARLLYSSPNGIWEDETFAEAYERGTVSFVFSNPVEFMSETIGTIEYLTSEGDDDSAPIKDYTSDWNMMDGLWVVSFDFRHEEWTADEISKIVIELNGVKSTIDDSSVAVAPLVLDNTKAPRRIKKAIVRDFISGDELVNIYNVQGVLVKEGINKGALNELPAGLYIVDGKKIVVR